MLYYNKIIELESEFMIAYFTAVKNNLAGKLFAIILGR